MDLPYVINTLAPFDASVTWIVVAGFAVSLILAFGIGANDAANSFGTAIGAKVFTLLQGLILASIFEMIGAIALGARVSDTVRGGLFDTSLYNGCEELLMVGQLSALTSACVWLLVATGVRIPVSASHSIVGASLGFHLVIYSGKGVDWFVIANIVISWIVSPLMSGIISCIIYLILKYTMLDRKQQLKWGLVTVPLWYFFVIFINILSIFLGVSQVTEGTVLGAWLAFIIAIGAGFWTSVGVAVFLVPYTRKKAIASEELDTLQQAEEENEANVVAKEGDFELVAYVNKGMKDDDGASMSSDGQQTKRNPSTDIMDNPDGNLPSNENVTTNGTDIKSREQESSITTDEIEVDDTKGIFTADKNSEDWKSVKDTPTVTTICGPLQGLSACFAAFSHGGNDVSNAIGPLVGLYLIYQEGRITTDSTPIWILIYGSVGIAIGLFVLGRRVIRTIGSDLTPMTPSTGFAINLGAATTVLTASLSGIPVSTTHCLVGSIACVGFLRARKAMDFKLFTGILSAWIITLPVTVLLSAALMGLIQHAVPGECDVPPQYNITNSSTVQPW